MHLDHDHVLSNHFYAVAYVDIFPMLCTMQNSFHRVSTFSLPRSVNRSRPSVCLILANTGSTVAILLLKKTGLVPSRMLWAISLLCLEGWIDGSTTSPDLKIGRKILLKVRGKKVAALRDIPVASLLSENFIYKIHLGQWSFRQFRRRRGCLPDVSLIGRALRCCPNYLIRLGMNRTIPGT